MTTTVPRTSLWPALVDQHRYDLPGPFGAGIPHPAGAAARRRTTEGHRS